jgi:nitroreductase
MIYSLKKYYYGEIVERSEEFYNSIKKRRSVKKFSQREVPFSAIENCILTANTAPSINYKKPWHFVVVRDPIQKKKVRIKVEKEDAAYYDKLATKEWLRDLELYLYEENEPNKKKYGHCLTMLHYFSFKGNEPSKMKDEKEIIIYPDRTFLEKAPYLIMIFAKEYFVDHHGEKKYYDNVLESVGIATGFLITALHQSGLVMLPYTINPTSYFNDIFNRPENEKPIFLIAVGSPEEGTKVSGIPECELKKMVTVF